MGFPGRIGDRVAHAERELAGRERELTELEACLEPDSPPVRFVHGIAGIGKSALLSALSARLAGRGAHVLGLDGRTVEPTPRGMLTALGQALGAPQESAVALGDFIGQLPITCVIAIDNMDALRLVEPWLRRELVVNLPLNARVLLFGRNPPQPAWHTSPGWSGIFRTHRLGPLEADVAHAWLRRRGLPEAEVPRVLALAHGHPLTLELAASSWERSGASERERGQLLELLAQTYLADVANEALRACVEAACLVRRATRPLLEAMLQKPVDDSLLDGLLELPFVERADDGITVTDSVRISLEGRLRALDPSRHQALRGAAWRYLRAQLPREPGAKVSWRTAADVLFLVRHPELREAFFPSTASAYTVETALPSDEAAIKAIVASHEPAGAHPIMDAWWRELPSAFNVARDGTGAVLGFIVLASHSAIPSRLVSHDPLVRAWLDEVGKRLKNQGALFARRTVTRADGELASDVMGALWVDAKRTYIEHLDTGSVYVATRTADASLPSLERLGFRRASGQLTHDGSTDETLRLDFGAQGILGWVAALVDAHERADTPWRLDEPNRSLMVGGQQVALTKLEYGTLHYLVGAAGRVVTRDELLLHVWGQPYGGSNVVDAVVRLLRKKLGPHAGALQTVKSFGYRMLQGREANVPLTTESETDSSSPEHADF